MGAIGSGTLSNSNMADWTHKTLAPKLPRMMVMVVVMVTVLVMVMVMVMPSIPRTHPDALTSESFQLVSALFGVIKTSR